MSYTQILILLMSTIAFSFLIYQADNPSRIMDNKNKGSINIIKTIGLFILQKIKEPILPMVSAQDAIAGWACCEKNKNGASCTYRPQEECNTNFQIVPTKCEETDYCTIGCCQVSNGACSTRTAKTNCKAKFFEDENCHVPECRKGCCILGSGSKFTTEENCDFESLSLGVSGEFKPEINSEVDCIYLTEKNKEGACVLGTDPEDDSKKNCIFTTGETCKKRNGEFFSDTFCSNPDLNTTCTAHHHTNCVSGKDSVYWFDLCNNREEIKETCNLLSGTKCGQYRPSIDTRPGAGSKDYVSGDYVCRDLSCNVKIGERTVNKKNGESWCVYEGTIGNGKDVVGSIHTRHICFMGEERVEACEDYRNQICVQNDAELESGQTFSEAACRINNWRSCLSYNIIKDSGGENPDNEKIAKECNENPDCFIKNINIADYYKFNFCVPKYPPGFDLTSDESKKDAELVCSTASQKCIVIYEKKIDGWDCVANCDCEKKEFTEKMNDFCVSLGDCGAYVNFVGEVTTDGYSVNRAPKLSNSYLDGLKKYALPNPTQKPAEPGNASFWAKFGVPGGVDYNPDKIGNVFFYAGLGLVGAGALIFAFGAAIYGNAIGAAGAALAASIILTMALGLKGDAAKIMLVAGLATGTIMAIVYLQGWNPSIWPAIVVLAVIAGILKILGIGKTKKKVVKFQCLPWEPPYNGNDCEKCNTNDPLGVLCSEYRCQSLGQSCKLINKGTGQEKCIAFNDNDVSSPRITPFYENITEGYQYSDVSEGSFSIRDLNGECVPEFTDITFGIKTNKLAICRIGTDILESYEEMGEDFNEGSIFSINHMSVLNIPSIAAFENYYNLTEEEIEEIGQINFYVRCKSVNGKENDASFVIRSCVKPGPDITAPVIKKIIPEINYVKAGQTETDATIYVSEPADCRYSISEDEEYDDMTNIMQCDTDLDSRELYGWVCNTNLTLAENNSRFYFRCKDQPWLPDTNESRNAMSVGEEYNLVTSASPLIIDDFSPEKGKEIISGFEPATVELKARTAGGIDGKAECYFSFDGSNFIRFLETNDAYHNQRFTSMMSGDYNINLRCIDVAGNIAENSTSFKISIDDKGPKITRIFYESALKIFTDENSECRYMFTSKFNWENATEMSGSELEHSADWQSKTYYVQCRDIYGNGGGKIVIRPYILTK